MSINSAAFEEQNNLNPDFPIVITKGDHAFPFPPHYHKWLEMVFMTEGTMTIAVNNRPYKLHQGDLLVIGSYHIHSFLPPSDTPAGFYMLRLDYTFLRELSVHDQYYQFLAPSLLQSNLLRTQSIHGLDTELSRLFHHLFQESQSGELDSRLLITAATYRLLALLTRHLLDSEAVDKGDAKQLQKSYDMIRRVNRLIYNHYQREITLEEAAETAGYSHYHFTRKFKSMTGFTFKAYLNDFRINMVKEALRTSNKPITDIAYSHGFNSLKTFNRNFQTLTGMTPSDYKKSNF